MELNKTSVEEVVLTPEQQQKIIDLWNSRPTKPPDLKEMVAEAFPGLRLDGRSKEGVAIKRFLSSKNITPRTLTTYHPQLADFILEDSHKEYILNNPEASNVEIARILFKDDKLTPLTIEARAVQAFKEIAVFPNHPELRNTAVYSRFKTKQYNPPKNFEGALNLINLYINKKLVLEKLTPKDKNDIIATMSYLRNTFFLHTIEQFVEPTHREILESQFITFVYDKSDLTPEEITLYINLALDSVHINQIQEQITFYTKLQEDCANDSDGQKVSMSLAETLHSLRQEYHQNKTRQQKLVDDLQGKRSVRLEGQMRGAASVLSLVKLWQEEEERKKLLALAIKEEELLKGEGERLASLEEVKAKILGIDIDETLGYSR